MTEKIFRSPTSAFSGFGAKPLMLNHRLHQSALFSDDMLATLIEHSARANYYVNTMDITRHDTRSRREGEIRDIPGHDVLEAIRTGAIWVLLLKPEQVDPAYGDLVQDIYREIAEIVPGFSSYNEKLSILVSSPNIQVYYHCDTPGQSLWQIRGRKTVYVYPNREPFLQQDRLEKIVLNEAHEISLRYDPAFEEHAVVYDLGPGEMLHWPLYCPHRIVNQDCVNVSFTTEHQTRDVRRNYIVNTANGVLRKRLGLQSLSQVTDGPLYYAKYGVAALHKLTAGRKPGQSFKVDFAVDPKAPRSVRDIPPYEFSK